MSFFPNRTLGAALLALLASASCGKSPTGPPPSLSLTVVPSPVTFSVLPPSLQPEASTPLCCPTLLARWTLVVAPTTTGDIVSATITVQNPVTRYVYVDRQFDAIRLAAQVPTHIEPGAAVAMPQALLETMPPQFSSSEPLRLRLEVAFRAGGQTVTAAVEPPFNEAR